MSHRRLDGKVAIITGASTGLGPVMAAMFVREGARVLLTARREELVRKAAAAAGDGAIAMRADVTNEADVAAMVSRAVDEFGHVDIMCNNAAAPGTDKWIWEQTLDNWNATIAIDVTAAMLCTREVLKRRNWVKRMADEQGVDVEAHRARLLQGVALRDISSTEDVANLALFLASDESRTITGQSIPVDAGGVMQG